MEGTTPDKFTFVQVITAYSSLQRLEGSRLVHEQLIQSGCKFDVFVGTSLVDRYANCGSIEDAWGVFNKMQSQNVLSWNAMA
jgi:pentatricopeptide repeat protein